MPTATVAELQAMSKNGQDDDLQQVSLFTVPEHAAFQSKLYRRAPELAEIAADLIEECVELAPLINCEVRFYWRAKTTQAGGRRKIGQTKRASDILGFELAADFVVWLAADTARETKFTDEQVKAAVYAQLSEIGTDDAGNFIKVKPDFQAFSGELTRFGAWRPDLRVAARAFTEANQAGLFDNMPDDEEDEGDEA